MNVNQDDKPMTIALVVDAVGNEGNGTSNSAMQFAEGLRALGHEVRLVGVGAGEYAAVEKRVPVVSPIADRQQMHFATASPELFRKAFDGADVVHLYLPFPFEIAARKAARAMRIPVSCAFHLQPENVLYSAGPLRYVPGAADGMYALFRREMYRWVRHVHVPTKMTARLLREHGYRNELHVISNGYDPMFAPKPGMASAQPWAAPSRAGSGAGAGDVAGGVDGAADTTETGGGMASRPFRVLASGRLASEKDQVTLIHALGMCRHRDDAELTIAGTGPLERSLTRECERWLARPAHIGFHAHADMPALLRSADLFVHPSIADLEGVSVMEALACGLVPVIADSDLSAARDFALDERSLYPVRDASALAARIDWWVDHPQERARMSGEYAREIARTHSLAASVQAFEAMERQAIADDRAWYAGESPRPVPREADEI